MTDKRKVWMNGRMVSEAQATVPLLSHGFSRGSAIFEAFGVHEGPEGPLVLRMDEHLKRLQRSAELLDMELAYSAQEIIEAVAETVRTNVTGRGLIKIMAYWGKEAVVKMVPDDKLDVAIFSIENSHELRLDDAQPQTACLSSWRKLHPETVPVEAKAVGNYLNGYMARKEAKSRRYDLGLMLDTDGSLAEGSIESVFLVRNGILLTPPLGRILSSISRMSVLEISDTVGIEAREEDLRAGDLFEAEEIFTAHSGVKVHPVRRFEERDLSAPGTITSELMKWIDDIIHFRTDRFSHFFQAL